MAVQSRPERAQQPGPPVALQENALLNADDFPIAVAVQQFIAEHPDGATDTATKLFQRLQKYKTDSDHLWPKSARGFAAALIKAASALRLAGIEVRRPSGNHTEAGNLWSIRARSDVSGCGQEQQSDVKDAEGSAEHAEHLCARQPVNAPELLEICQAQGLTFTLAADGIDVTGDPALLKKWAPMLEENVETLSAFLGSPKLSP